MMSRVPVPTAARMHHCSYPISPASEHRTTNDPYAQGVFCGLVDSTDRAALTSSVLEGVAFAVCDGLDALHADGTRKNALTLIGGGARRSHSAQLVADVLGIPISRQPNAPTVAA